VALGGTGRKRVEKLKVVCGVGDSKRLEVRSESLGGLNTGVKGGPTESAPDRLPGLKEVFGAVRFLKIGRPKRRGRNGRRNWGKNGGDDDVLRLIPLCRCGILRVPK